MHAHAHGPTTKGSGLGASLPMNEMRPRSTRTFASQNARPQFHSSWRYGRLTLPSLATPNPHRPNSGYPPIAVSVTAVPMDTAPLPVQVRHVRQGRDAHECPGQWHRRRWNRWCPGICQLCRTCTPAMRVPGRESTTVSTRVGDARAQRPAPSKMCRRHARRMAHGEGARSTRPNRCGCVATPREVVA